MFQRAFICLAVALFLAGGRRGQTKEGDLVAYIPFATVAPQDIAYDDTDGSYWITAFLDNLIYHYSPGLEQDLESFPSPFAGNRYITGIAYNAIDDTLLVAESLTGRIVEIDKFGQRSGREIAPEYNPVVNPNAKPVPRGMAFDRLGDEGRGSLYLVESLGTLIYEVALDGRTIRSFVHPDDPDGFPGSGGTAPASDIELIYEDDRLAGFYLTGGRGQLDRIRRLDADGNYTGISISLEDAGGNVSGILRHPFQAPGVPAPRDSYVCVVESNARFAILEGGEPAFREVLDFVCVASGKQLELTWKNPQAYDRIEVLEGCNILASLPGTESRWVHEFETEGVHRVILRASRGADFSETPSCMTVVGAGEVLSSADVAGDPPEPMLPIDLATDGRGSILVSTNVSDGTSFKGKVLIFDLEGTRVSTLDVSEAFAGPEDYITGVAYVDGPDGEFIVLFNASQSTVGLLDPALVSTFTAKLPNLETDPEKDPYYGFVAGMSHDPSGDGGEGSLWLVETERGWIYEIDFEGNILQGFPHPYTALDPPPAGTPFTAFSSGISEVPGNSEELYLSGGTLHGFTQNHIFRMNKKTRAIVPGSAFPTDGIRSSGSSSYFTFEPVEKSGETRLMVLSIAGTASKLLEVMLGSPAAPAPVFLTARQRSYANEAYLEFTNGASYDRVEVFRDCQRLAEIAGEATSFLDTAVEAGHHTYAVRGVLGGKASSFAEASVQVGTGAVLQRAFLWPARYPQQLTQDPVDGSYVVVTSYPGDERKLFLYDKNLRYLQTRETVVESPWQIATVAVRVTPAGKREYNYIVWKQPVPIGGAGQEEFFLVREDISGEKLGEVAIQPPIPTNGFVVYPTGLAWERTSDTFYYLERNSRNFVQMSAQGETLRIFPHPAPPFQNFVFNLGVDWVSDRETLFITGSGRRDHKVTMVREMGVNGQLTGVEIPLAHLPATITGITVAGPDLIAVGSGSASEIFRIKAFEALPPSFVRGDSDGNGQVNITDALVTLNYLFKSGPAPPCGDGADADDSSVINLTDAVAVLLALFAGGEPLPPPYPDPGLDPTADGLSCP